MLSYVPDSLEPLLAAAHPLERLTLAPSAGSLFDLSAAVPDAIRPLVAPSGRRPRRVGAGLLAPLADAPSLRLLMLPEPEVAAELAAARPELVVQPTMGGATVDVPSPGPTLSAGRSTNCGEASPV